MTIQISYDRTQREYRFLDPTSGEILTAPSGSQNKAALWRAAVGMLYPEVFELAQKIIDKHPQLERVTWRAVQLVIDDAVELLAAPAGNVVAMVRSSDEFGRYAISMTDREHVCQCQHYQNMDAPITVAGRRVCKHIAAHEMVKRLQTEF